VVDVGVLDDGEWRWRRRAGSFQSDRSAANVIYEKEAPANHDKPAEHDRVTKLTLARESKKP
jgi:hypothetical protein